MKRRTICHFQSTRTINLSTRTTSYMVNSQRFPCGTTASIYRKRNPQGKFPLTSSRSPWRRRGLWGRINLKTQKTRMRISIPFKMERIPYHWCNVGIWIGILRWWLHANWIQKLTATLTINLDHTHVLPVSLPPPSLWDLPRMVWCRLEKPYPMHPRAPEQVRLFGVNLRHWVAGYKAGTTLWRRPIDPPSPPVNLNKWRNKIFPSKPSFPIPTSISQPTPLLNTPFHSTKSLLFSLPLMKQPLMIS